MSNVTSVLAQAKALSEQEQQELLTQLEEYLILGSQVAQVTKEVKEMRFSKGRVCCHCNIPHNYTMIKDFKTRQPIFI